MYKEEPLEGALRKLIPAVVKERAQKAGTESLREQRRLMSHYILYELENLGSTLIAYKSQNNIFQLRKEYGSVIEFSDEIEGLTRGFYGFEMVHEPTAVASVHLQMS